MMTNISVRNSIARLDIRRSAVSNSPFLPSQKRGQRCSKPQFQLSHFAENRASEMQTNKKAG